MTSKSRIKDNTYSKGNSKILSYLNYALLILLFYPPFFRGLFFQKELMPTHIFTAIIFILFFYITKQDDTLKKYSLIELGYTALTLLYIGVVFFAVNKDFAIQEALKSINYLLILLMTTRLMQDIEKIKTTLLIFMTASVFVVFIGIGSALDTFHYKGAFVKGMMSSTFQYHNTFGTYCLSILFIGYMFFQEFNGKVKYLINACNFILFFGLILSYSRGAWILVPVVGSIYYLMIPLEYKKSFIAGLIGNVVALAIIINPFIALLEKENKSIGWLWVIVGMALSVSISYVIERTLNRLNLKNRVYSLIIPIISLSIPIIGLVIKDQILSFLPDTLAQRLKTISLGTETVTERTVFYKDAFEMIKDYPILGAGGGGWSTLYTQYQSYGYTSAQTHNYYMQLWIEIGTIGIILFASILVVYLYQFYKAYRACVDPRSKALLVSIFVASLTILAHSTIDFNMALSAIAILVWGLIGLQLTFGGKVFEITSRVGRPISYLIVGLSIVLITISTTNYLAYDAAKQGIKYMQAQQVSKGVSQFKKATLLNPFKPEYLLDYANYTNGIAYQNNDMGGLDKSIERMDKAVELGKYDQAILTNALGFYFRNKEIDKAIKTMEQLEKHYPLKSETYEVKSTLYMLLAEHYREIDEVKKAKNKLQDVVEIESLVVKLNEKISQSVVVNNMVKFVEITPKTKENILKSKELLIQTD